MTLAKLALTLVAALALTVAVRAETPDQWIALGSRVHGGFGSFIPVGIRIGLDALQRLDAKPREVTVVHYDSDKAPCACIADGVAIDASKRGTAHVADRTGGSSQRHDCDDHRSAQANGRGYSVYRAGSLALATGRMEPNAGCSRPLRSSDEG
jgi:hypothetical protein